MKVFLTTAVFRTFVALLETEERKIDQSVHIRSCVANVVMLSRETFVVGVITLSVHRCVYIYLFLRLNT